MPPTYEIVRFYANKPGRYEPEPNFFGGKVSGLTLDEAQEHCHDNETSSRTCETTEALDHTCENGPWFDGYSEEVEKTWESHGQYEHSG